MTPTLDAYAPFVGTGTIEELRLLGDRLRGRALQNINSTAIGGGLILAAAVVAILARGARVVEPDV